MIQISGKTVPRGGTRGRSLGNFPHPRAYHCSDSPGVKVIPEESRIGAAIRAIFLSDPGDPGGLSLLRLPLPRFITKFLKKKNTVQKSIGSALGYWRMLSDTQRRPANLSRSFWLRLERLHFRANFDQLSMSKKSVLQREIRPRIRIEATNAYLDRSSPSEAGNCSEVI